MTDDQLIHELVEFGLTEREAGLYLAMLGQEEISAGDLHRLTGMNRAKTYTVLAQMVSRGFCKERKEGRNRYFRPMPPETILEGLKAQWTRTQQRAESVFDELDDVFKRSTGTGRLLDMVEVVRGQQQHANRLKYLSDHVEEEVLALARGPYPLMEVQPPARMKEMTTIPTSSRVRDWAVYMTQDPYFESILPVIRRSVGLRSNEQMRVLDYVPLKMYIYDRKLVYMTLPSGRAQHSPDSTMVLIEDRGVAELCRNAFFSFWEQARPFEEWDRLNAAGSDG